MSTESSHPGRLEPLPPSAPSGSASGPRGFGALAVLSAGLGFFLFGLYRNRAFFHDDAYITLRYARNLLAGNSLTWNPGEAVEGYTSFLGTTAVALIGASGLALVDATRVLNAGAVLVLGLFLFRVLLARQGRRSVRDPLAAALPTAMVWGSLPLGIWVLGGLEGPLFALLVAIGAVLVIRILDGDTRISSGLYAGCALALVVLTRPDGGIFLIVAGGFLTAVAIARGSRERRSLFAFCAAALALLLPHLAWRYFTYDAFLPNPVHAKVFGVPSADFERGSNYVGPFVIHAPHWPLLCLLGIAAAWRTRGERLGLAFLLTSILVYGALILQAGGDHMPGQRLLLPLIPLCAIGFGAGLDRYLAGRRWLLGALPLALVVAQLSYFPALPEDPASRMGTLMGKHIADKWPDDTLIALNTAGSTPYFAPRYRYIDMLGLNDSHIARRPIEEFTLPQQHMPGHAKGDGQYILERDPDIIIIGPAQGTRVSRAIFLSGYELGQLPAFEERYGLVIEPVDGEDPLKVAYYRRRQGQ